MDYEIDNTDCETEDILEHEGKPRRSGRYPWGSGDEPYQRSGDFLSRIESLKSEGKTEKEIADIIGLTTTQLRTQRDLAKNERRMYKYNTAKALRDKGYSLNDIAEQMGYKNDSSVRSLLNENTKLNKSQIQTTVDILRNSVDEKGMIDVGVGTELELGISKERLKQALYALEIEGYKVYGGRIPQPTNPNQMTTLKVLCPPGTEHKEIYDYEKIQSMDEYISKDNGENFDTLVYPKSIDSNRVAIRYSEDGGDLKDGVIELRRNVEDLSLNGSNYAQVRILVDDNKYLKGMAIYSDDIPQGSDIVFNTNKSNTVSKADVMKNITNDPDNPFGSLIKKQGQSYYIDKDGKRQLSAINKRAEEGDWSEWKDRIPSQFLSKQSITLINKQLGLAKADRQAEFEDIMALDNPTVKKVLLSKFAEDCDSAAVHLYAAALPRQKHQVIFPVNSLNDKEVYAPNFRNGEKVALVRYPHGGVFEIPELTVNNKHPQASKLLGGSLDAVGINSKVASQLSGADFDGDTVMVIPTKMRGNIKIITKPPLAGLKDFDPKLEYGYDDVKTGKDGVKRYYKNGREFKVMNNTQTEMGVVSNLITDMTLKGAGEDDIVKAVKHSMVVIDAEKHKLDYRASAIDNDIKYLKNRYQGRIEDGKYKEGASTLISKAKSEERILKRKGSPKIDPDTGELIYKTVDEEYIDAKGKVQKRTQISTKMAETKDARTLSSGRPQEEAYAEYANSMKALANRARKETLSVGKIAMSPSAKEVYAEEVKALTARLQIAKKNAPKEREAIRQATVIVAAKKQSNPGMSKKELKKIRQQALTAARAKLGAKRENIKITDREWEAIQAGAISETKLREIILNTDMKNLRERATPRSYNTLTPAKVGKAQAMYNSGYTLAEIADTLGVSASTIGKTIKGKGE